jgi:hypothetical protein
MTTVVPPETDTVTPVVVDARLVSRSWSRLLVRARAIAATPSTATSTQWKTASTQGR